MNEPAIQNNNIEKIKQLFLYQHKTATNLNILADIKGGNLNDLEQLFFDAVMLFFWENASGKQLDFIGKLVDFERLGRSDEIYKTLLKFKIRLNMSAGQIPVLIDAVRVLYNASIVHYIQDYIEAKPVVEFYTDGSINLFDYFVVPTEDETMLLTFDRKEEQYLETEDGFILSDENYNALTVYAHNSNTDIGSGDIMLFSESDPDTDETILVDLLPAGVGLKLRSILVLEDGETILIDEKNNAFYV